MTLTRSAATGCIRTVKPAVRQTSAMYRATSGSPGAPGTNDGLLELMATSRRSRVTTVSRSTRSIANAGTWDNRTTDDRRGGWRG